MPADAPRPEPDLVFEQRCLERIRVGDREAFAELYRVFAPRLYREVLLPKLGHAHAAEDALSETFRSLIEHAHELSASEQSLLPWLVRVASNKAIDMHRKNARATRALTSFESALRPLLSEGDDPSARLEQGVLRERAKRRVADVLQELHPRYRRALELRFLEDLPRERCAAELDVKLGTFDVLLLRALRSFRKQWELVVGMRGSDPGQEASG